MAGALRNDPTQWPPGLPTAPADRGAGLQQARLALFLCAFKANNARAWGGAEQLKLAHLSWSVIEVSLGPDFGELVGHLNKVKVGRRNHPPLTAIDCEQALAVLVVLRRVRNRLPISHGRPRDPAGLQRVIDLAFRPNGGRLTFGELLELAVAAVGQVFPRPPGTIDDRLIVLFESLLGQLETLV